MEVLSSAPGQVHILYNLALRRRRQRNNMRIKNTKLRRWRSLLISVFATDYHGPALTRYHRVESCTNGRVFRRAAVVTTQKDGILVCAQLAVFPNKLKDAVMFRLMLASCVCKR